VPVEAFGQHKSTSGYSGFARNCAVSSRQATDSTEWSELQELHATRVFLPANLAGPFFFAPSMPARDHFVHFLQRRQMMSEIVEIITALVRMFLPDRKE
jgi:hypothetical protein